MSIIETLHNFLNTYPPLAEDRINVDFLGADAGEYSLETVPCSEWVRRYVDGSGVKQFQFIIASRNQFDDTIRRQLDNISFYENFSAWLEKQTTSRALPDLGVNRNAIKLETVSSGYAFQQGENTARYQMQCKLTYLQEKEQ